MIADDTSFEETDLLIVGAGPAGASLACFLSEYGLSGIMIASAPGTSDTPRAHITNMAALECLRDIGLEAECLAQATKSDCMEHTRWCYSMAGEEFARIHSWGHDPHRVGDYWDASPCQHVDLPQTLAEPILVNRARQKGWDVRFNTALIEFAEHDDCTTRGVASTVRDATTGTTYTIRSRFLFGCDGGRSTVVRQLDLPLIKKPGGGIALNVLVDADLSHLIKSRVGNLHWTIQPDRPHPKWGHMCIVRMVKAWHEWMFIILPEPDWDPKSGEPTEEEYIARVRDFIGDDNIPVKLVDISKWAINEVAAEQYSSPSQRIHCLGDAVHRHPPFNGLGSNTCIQDAYNLAWKIAYHMRGLAGPAILPTYSVERAPVGLGVVTRANQGFRDHLPVLEALGVTQPTLEARTAAFAELSQSTPAAAARRARLRTAIQGTEREFHALGQEMNQRYDGSRAVYVADEPAPRPPLPPDPVLTHWPSTYPGARLPHAWLNTRVPQDPSLSTHDLAGHTRFTLLTGPGDVDLRWRRAASRVGPALGLRIECVSIGWMCDYEDVYGDWARRREVEDGGCVLVRPDRFVGWRCFDVVDDPDERLERALRGILCLG